MIVLMFKAFVCKLEAVGKRRLGPHLLLVPLPAATSKLEA